MSTLPAPMDRQRFILILVVLATACLCGMLSSAASLGEARDDDGPEGRALLEVEEGVDLPIGTSPPLLRPLRTSLLLPHPPPPPPPPLLLGL